jgi:sugar phosphate isomerase/epimerase
MMQTLIPLETAPMSLDDARIAALSRRGFLHTSLAGTAAGIAAAAAPARAASPLPRGGKAPWRLSVAGYSFNRHLPTNWTPEDLKKAAMTLEGFIEFCAGLGLDGVELTAYYFPKIVTPEYLASLKNLTFRLGLEISGTAIGNDFCVAEGEPREKQLKLCRDWIDHSAALGAPVIRIFAGQVPKGDSEQASLDRCVSAIDESLEYAATKGVFLALENHGGITGTSEQMLKIIERVKPSPWFGVNLDGGNFRTADPYADLERIAPYAINAQVKASVAPNGKTEEADLGRILGLLKKAGYRGYIVLEYEEKAEPREAVPVYVKKLRELMAA